MKSRVYDWCEWTDYMCTTHSRFEITSIARGRRGRDGMVVGLTTTCAISAYHH
jgi:hypothetical protein